MYRNTIANIYLNIAGNGELKINYLSDFSCKTKDELITIYNKKKLMGHRISEESTTTSIINDGIRTNEDFSIYSMFWPKFMAKLLAGIYKNSEKSNKIKR